MDIIIHIGPPKTGSSAIQNWLQENRSTLSRNGFFYPAHKVDENGVSSGNVSSLYELSSEGNVFSVKKLDELCTKARDVKCHTILLSSEFFFRDIVLLQAHIPQATFIAYVRNPADIYESNYNQGVKRHGYTDPLLPPKALLLGTIVPLVKKAELLQGRLILRSYHKQAFTGGNIVRDFLSAIGLSDISVADDKNVNPSYCFETLEFKRWLNHYSLSGISHWLDIHLQAYNRGTSHYTFINRNQFHDYKRQAIHWLKKLDDVYDDYDASGLIQLIEAQEHRVFLQQKISELQCDEVIEYLASEDNSMMRLLALSIYAQPDVAIVEPYFRCIFKRFPPKSLVPSFWDWLKRDCYRRFDCIDVNPDIVSGDKYRIAVAAYIVKPSSLWRYIKLRYYANGAEFK